jgi:hypothetical protein
LRQHPFARAVPRVFAIGLAFFVARVFRGAIEGSAAQRPALAAGRDLRSHKPFTVLQQFRPKFQPAHMFGLNTVAIEAGRVKRKF